VLDRVGNDDEGNTMVLPMMSRNGGCEKGNTFGYALYWGSSQMLWTGLFPRDECLVMVIVQEVHDQTARSCRICCGAFGWDILSCSVLP